MRAPFFKKSRRVSPEPDRYNNEPTFREFLQLVAIEFASDHMLIDWRPN
jgi:hypothetical protein